MCTVFLVHCQSTVCPVCFVEKLLTGCWGCPVCFTVHAAATLHNIIPPNSEQALCIAGSEQVADGRRQLAPSTGARFQPCQPCHLLCACSIAPKLDLVLLSQPDLAHLGALPALLAHDAGVSAPVYAAAPIVKLGQILFHDCFASQWVSVLSVC